MKRILTIATMLLIAMPVVAQLQPGKETAIPIPSMGTEMKLYVPSNYSTDRLWPILFFYHGLGGKPDTSLLRSHTGGTDYIIVGMSYMESGVPQRSAERQRAYMARERDQLRAALTWLHPNANIDRSRVFLAGVSKGGWHVSALADQNVGAIAGLVVMIGGRTREDAKKPGIRFKDRTIYVGAGETDGGFIAAVRACEYYRKQGAFVTFDLYEGLGHRMPPRMPRLVHWLNAQLVYGQSKAREARLKLREELGSRYKEILALQDADDKYARLREFADDPRLSFCGAATYNAVHQKLSAVASASSSQGAWTAEQEFHRLAWKESHMRRLMDLEEVVLGMRRLTTEHGDTLYGRAASRSVGLLEKAYERSAGATAKAREEARASKPAPRPVGTVVPSFPSVNRRTSRVPRREGNKIIFGQKRDEDK